jgi:hypothetical protein
MKHFYFFKSSRKSDKLTTLSIFTTSVKRAYALAQLHFFDKGYKGMPVRLAI